MREGKGRPVDGLAMWARRLAVYDAEDPRVGKKTGGLRATPSSRGVDPGTGKCAVTGVPKTLGVARCSATGLYTCFAADGHRLKEHPDVPNLFYCEKWYDDFKRLDATMQRAIVDWHASRARGARADPGFGGGVSKEGAEWKPVRPACESWVVNRHMKLARADAAPREGHGGGSDHARGRGARAKCAAAEKAQDAAARAAQKAATTTPRRSERRCGAAVETRAERDDRAATDARAGGKTTASAGNKSPKKLPETSVGSGTRPSTRAAALLAERRRPARKPRLSIR